LECAGEKCSRPADDRHIDTPHEKQLRAADQVADILARHGERGFAACGGPPGAKDRTVDQETLHRLCLLADETVVPPVLRKLASHCGGIPPSARFPAFVDTPQVADPSNKVYAAWVRRLLSYTQPEAEDAWRVQKISAFNEGHQGDLVEASLAAAEAAAARAQGRERSWAGLVGGGHAADDRVTPFIVAALQWEGLGPPRHAKTSAAK